MVSTRRSGSNSSKRSSSSEDNSPSPKRQKVDNGGSPEKPVPAADNSKELCTPEPVPDTGECSSRHAPITGVGVTDGMSPCKGDATPPVPVTTPVANATCTCPSPLFSSRSVFEASGSAAPWCRFLSQTARNPNVAVYTPNFTIGSSKNCNFQLKDHAISGNLCKIKHTQGEGSAVAVLESTGSKGSVLVNGILMKKNTSCVLNSGDEVVFGVMGNHSYIFQQLNNEVVVRGVEVQSGVGKSMKLERRGGDSSAVAGASILASLSNLKQALPIWKIPSQTFGKPNQAPNLRSDKAADVGTSDKNSTMDCNPEAGTEVLEERNAAWDQQAASTSGTSVRCAVFKEDVRAAILDGKGIDVSFDSFPYYLSENTKDVLVAACFIHLKHNKEHEKCTADLTTINPRILLSGPAGSEIYQEMLAKALAKYFGAKLLIFENHLLLGGLSSKEAELLKDGFNTEKSCSSAKQSPTITDLARNMDPPATETETSTSLNAPTSIGLESQQNLKTDNIPSTTGTAKNCLFKLGDRVKFSCSSCGLYQTCSRYKFVENCSELISVFLTHKQGFVQYFALVR